MKVVYGVILTLLVLILGGLAVIFSGVYNVAADRPHAPLIGWVLHATREHSIESRLDTVEVPELTDARVRRGARSYDAMCAGCHLKPGGKKTPMHVGLNPEPPELSGEGEMEPAEIFWVVKHGIRMTGMPAWGETHSDESLWDVVAFVDRLPDLSREEYDALAGTEEAGSGMSAGGHHAGGHQEGSHDEDGHGDSGHDDVASDDEGHSHESQAAHEG